MNFRPGCATVDQLCRVIEGVWDFAHLVHMCFVNLEKVFDCVPPGALLVGRPIHGSIRYLYKQSRSFPQVCHDEERAEQKDKAVDLLVRLCLYP